MAKNERKGINMYSANECNWTCLECGYIGDLEEDFGDDCYPMECPCCHSTYTAPNKPKRINYETI